MTSGRVVLFGGHGFIGSALRRDLQGEVVAPTRDEVDLVDRDAVRRFLRPGDFVVNAAGYAAATDRSPAGLLRLRRENVTAVDSLAAAAAAADVAHLIHISSVAAMGHRAGRGLTEDDLAAPRNPYGASKRAAELVLEEYRRRVPWTILRPTSVFGEGRGLAGLLCRLALLPVVPLPRGGTALIPFTYVANLSEAVRLTIGNPRCVGRTLIVGDVDSYPLRSVVTELAAALGRSSTRILPLPVAVIGAVGLAERVARRIIGGAPILDPVRIETLSRSISYSIDAFRDATGYAPPVTLPVAMRRIAAWYPRRSR